MTPVELVLPPEPVRLAPGSETRIAVAVRNASAAAAELRVGVASGRVAGWARAEPSAVAVPAGGVAEVTLVVRPPRQQPAGPALIPFTVRAQDAASGESVGWATGLVTVARPDVIAGELASGGIADHFRLSVRSVGDDDVTIGIGAVLDPPGGTASADPAAALVPAGGTAMATVRARPRRALWGPPRPYTVVVSVRDAAGSGDAPPLLTVRGAGTRRPLMSTRAAAVAGVVLLVLVTAMIVRLGPRIPLPGRAASHSTAATPSATPIRHPYVLVDVFPHRDADGGRGAAQAARNKLTADGMQVRLVDSLASDELADAQGGFWVLLQDGFGSVAAAQQYCDRFRATAPKCRVVP